MTWGVKGEESADPLFFCLSLQKKKKKKKKDGSQYGHFSTRWQYRSVDGWFVPEGQSKRFGCERCLLALSSLPHHIMKLMTQWSVLRFKSHSNIRTFTDYVMKRLRNRHETSTSTRRESHGLTFKSFYISVARACPFLWGFCAENDSYLSMHRVSRSSVQTYIRSYAQRALGVLSELLRSDLQFVRLLATCCLQFGRCDGLLGRKNPPHIYTLTSVIYKLNIHSSWMDDFNCVL